MLLLRPRPLWAGMPITGVNAPMARLRPESGGPARPISAEAEEP
jgi:hypothetical protein